MDLGHRPIDAPGLAHFAPVKYELLSGRCQVHGTFRLDWIDDSYRNITRRSTPIQGACGSEASRQSAVTPCSPRPPCPSLHWLIPVTAPSLSGTPQIGFIFFFAISGFMRMA